MKSAAWTVLLVLAGCGSTPETRFHTLMPAAGAAWASANAGPLAWELAPVAVPAQVNQPQWVLRRNDETLAVLEHERWAALLEDELRGALALRIESALAAAKPQATTALTRWRITLQVQRFEAQLGRYSRIEALWAVQGAPTQAPLRCRAGLRQDAGQGLLALAVAHRAVVAQLGDAIARSLIAAQSGLDAC